MYRTVLDKEQKVWVQNNQNKTRCLYKQKQIIQKIYGNN